MCFFSVSHLKFRTLNGLSSRRILTRILDIFFQRVYNFFLNNALDSQAFGISFGISLSIIEALDFA